MPMGVPPALAGRPQKFDSPRRGNYPRSEGSVKTPYLTRSARRPLPGERAGCDVPSLLPWGEGGRGTRSDEGSLGNKSDEKLPQTSFVNKIGLSPARVCPGNCPRH